MMTTTTKTNKTTTMKTAAGRMGLRGLGALASACVLCATCAAWGQQLEPRGGGGGERERGTGDQLPRPGQESRVERLALVGVTEDMIRSADERFAPELDWEAGAADDRRGLEWFAPHLRAEQAEREDALVRSVSPEVLRRYHELLASEPHPAGSSGDLRVIRELEALFKDMGLLVTVQWLSVMLPRPVDAELEIVSGPGLEAGMSLSVAEPAVEGQDAGSRKALDIGWNAYSASGDVTGEVVYANYGTRADFERLEELGVEVAGKVVLARYGKVYRGVKAERAEEAGASALVLFTDPSDAGGEHGERWPEGGWPNERAIQRGSVLPMSSPGDPGSPGFAALASERRERLSEEEMGLPGIVVQPIGWGSAREILSRMDGEPAPAEWAGGIEGVEYRVSGGDELRVRVMVEQELRATVTANVIAALEPRGGSSEGYPLLIGSHHDAWTYGASDPLSGTICMLETARVLSERARSGDRPTRPILFAAWGAEEYGLVGAVEYVESMYRELRETGLGYINLDMSAMGPNFAASASPELAGAVIDATRNIRHLNDESATVFGTWLERTRGDDSEAAEPRVGVPGGGSDHVPFAQHVGVPVVTLGSWGASGAAYHSADDTLEWYWSTVGEDYLPAAMVSRVAAVLASRLAWASVPQIEHRRVFAKVSDAVDSLAAAAEERGLEFGFGALTAERLRGFIEEARESAAAFEDVLLAKIDDPSLTRGDRELIVSRLVRLSRAWVSGEGFYRNDLFSVDLETGYGMVSLPGLRRAVIGDEAGDATAMREGFGGVVRGVVPAGRTFGELAEEMGLLRPVTLKGWRSSVRRLGNGGVSSWGGATLDGEGARGRWALGASWGGVEAGGAAICVCWLCW